MRFGILAFMAVLLVFTAAESYSSGLLIPARTFLVHASGSTSAPSRPASTPAPEKSAPASKKTISSHSGGGGKGSLSIQKRSGVAVGSGGGYSAVVEGRPVPMRSADGVQDLEDLLDRLSGSSPSVEVTVSEAKGKSYQARLVKTGVDDTIHVETPEGDQVFSLNVVRRISFGSSRLGRQDVEILTETGDLVRGQIGARKVFEIFHEDGVSILRAGELKTLTMLRN